MREPSSCFERRGQLMIDESALSDFPLQHLLENRESFDGLVQVPVAVAVAWWSRITLAPDSASPLANWRCIPALAEITAAADCCMRPPYTLALRKCLG